MSEPIPYPTVIRENTLIAWQCTPQAPVIQAAHQTRDWMDQSDQRFPYRCLPLVIANSFGWDILNPLTFSASWNGGKSPTDVQILWPTNQRTNLPQAHFGVGVLTFTMSHLFQTSPGMNLYVKGPPNEPKDGIIPLEGIIETDWCPATFTMNWLFTRPGHQVTFTAGESICRIFPVPRNLTEAIHPEIRMLEDNPGLAKLHQDWRLKRDEFNAGLKIPDSEFSKRKWQKEYFQGGGVEVWPKFENHQTKLHQEEFTDHRSADSHLPDLVPVDNLRSIQVRGLGGQIQTLFIKNHLFSEDYPCPYRFPAAKLS
jgi:hypothetical protein